MRGSLAIRYRQILSGIAFGAEARSGTPGGFGLAEVQISSRKTSRGITARMAEFESSLKPVLEVREARSQRLHQILRTPDDLISVV